MTYDEVEKQAASVENLLAPHFQDERIVWVLWTGLGCGVVVARIPNPDCEFHQDKSYLKQLLIVEDDQNIPPQNMLLLHNDYFESKSIKILQSWGKNSLPSALPHITKSRANFAIIKMSPSAVPGREKQLLIPGTLNHLRQHDSYQTRDWYLINLCDKLCKMFYLLSF